MSGKREQQAEERRNQLIDTALQLFSEHGIEATRVSDIAQTAGVAQGLLYHYFPSKDALVAAIIQRHGPLDMITGLLATPPERPARETLLDLGMRVYAFAQERRALLRLVAREIIWQPETRQIGLAIRGYALQMLGRYLQSRVEAGELRPHNSDVIGQTFVSSVLIVAIAELPADPYISGAVDLILQGIAVSRDGDSTPHSKPTGG